MDVYQEKGTKGRLPKPMDASSACSLMHQGHKPSLVSSMDGVRIWEFDLTE